MLTQSSQDASARSASPALPADNSRQGRNRDTPLRLFFALFPPPAATQALAAAAAAAHPACGGRPTRLENLHITLAFLGRATHEQADELAALARSIASPEGEVVIDRYGSFPRARVVWAGPDPASAGARQLQDMARALWDELRPLGWPGPDVSPLRPHVTLLHRVERRDTAGLAFPPVAWPHRGYALVASQAGHGGSVYRVLARTR